MVIIYIYYILYYLYYNKNYILYKRSYKLSFEMDIIYCVCETHLLEFNQISL